MLTKGSNPGHRDYMGEDFASVHLRTGAATLKPSRNEVLIYRHIQQTVPFRLLIGFGHRGIATFVQVVILRENAVKIKVLFFLGYGPNDTGMVPMPYRNEWDDRFSICGPTFHQIYIGDEIYRFQYDEVPSMAMVEYLLPLSHLIAAASDRLVPELFSRAFRGVFQVHSIRSTSPFSVQNTRNSTRQFWHHTLQMVRLTLRVLAYTIVRILWV